MKHLKLFEEYEPTPGSSGNLNKLAYDGLKKIGHRFADEPFDPELNYVDEWEEAKQSPDLFDDFSSEEREKFGIDEKETGAYKAPTHVVKPQKGDKVYKMTKKSYKKAY